MQCGDAGNLSSLNFGDIETVGQLNAFKKPGYWPLFLTGANIYYEHALCGEHSIQGAVSPNSRRPLLRVFSLDLRDERLGIRDFPAEKLNFFFSWTCDISRGVLTYQIKDDTAIQILNYKDGAAYTDFPYPDYPNYFPQRLFELRKISDDEQKAMAAINRKKVKISSIHDERPDLVRPQHQFRGEPFFVNAPRQLACPSCEAVMPVFASAGDETMSQRGFVHSNFVQVLFHLCTSCAIVSAYQLAD
jgi:hypothetical protein